MKYFSTLLTLALTRPDKALSQSVSAGFGGTMQADGNMFEIAAKGQPVLIERLDINMDAATDPVQVYYRIGYVDYRYDDSYKLVYGGDITGAGKGLVTPLPSFTSPVLVTPGTPVTFYVTVANTDGANLWYDVGVGSGTTYASDDNINIIEGFASGYPWRGYALDRKWNGKSNESRNVIALLYLSELELMCVIFFSTGIVHYSIQTSSSPTASPTISLSTPNPTNQPTKSPVAITKSPTAFPVISPPTTRGNDLDPTASPVATPTGSPVRAVDDVEVDDPPTLAPTNSNKPTTSEESSDTKSPSKSPTKKPTDKPQDGDNEPTLSPTVQEETFGPTKNVTNLLPNLDSSSAFGFNFMGRMCSYSFPLFIIAFFVL